MGKLNVRPPPHIHTHIHNLNCLQTQVLKFKIQHCFSMQIFSDIKVQKMNKADYVIEQCGL